MRRETTMQQKQRIRRGHSTNRSSVHAAGATCVGLAVGSVVLALTQFGGHLVSEDVHYEKDASGVFS
jgi:hypothetical protein